MATKKQPPKRPASHQRQTAANKAREKKNKEIFMGISRTGLKKSNESELQYIKRGAVEQGRDIMKMAGSATKAVKKVVKKLNG